MIPSEWERIHYFVAKEFDSPDSPGSGSMMDRELVRGLDLARSIAGIPFKVSSGYRTAVHNSSVGGKPDSAHLYWCAADIVAIRPETRYLVLRGLVMAGFRRLEVAPRHIHVDVMDDLAHPSGMALFLDTVTGDLV